MKFACPHCAQNLEITDEWVGYEFNCPACQQSVTVPEPMRPIIANPSPASVAVKPRPVAARPPVARPPGPTRNVQIAATPPSGGGFWKFLGMLLLVAISSFLYACFHFNESAQQVWTRFVHYVESLQKQTPVSTPGPEPAVVVSSTPMPFPTAVATPVPTVPLVETPSPIPIDPLAWLLEHKEHSPKELQLLRPATLSLSENGKLIGSVTVPAGSKAQIVAFTAQMVELRVGAAVGQVPLEATNLRALAKIEQEKPEPNLDASTPTAQLQALASKPAVGFPTPRFVHPSVPFTREDLEILKTNITREPWKSGFDALAADGHSKLEYKMAGPFEEVKRARNLNLYPWRSDMTAIHNLAVMWWFTGKSEYAQKAHDILIAYAKTEKVFGGSEAGLDLGDYVWRYVVGADILRGTWPGWTQADTDLVKKLFLEVYWPGLGIDGNIIGPANKGMLVVASGAGIAAFCDDRARLEHIASLIRKSAGTGLLDTLPTGEEGETGRDGGHSFHTWECLTFAAEVLWKQGIDIYSEWDNRILSNGEYYARNNLALNSPFVPFGSVDAVYGRANPNPGWPSASRRAMALLHGAYYVRKGITAPYLERYRQAMPLGGGADWMYEKTVDHSTATPLTPVAFPPTERVSTGLAENDIGGSQPKGSSSYSAGVWTLTGGGSEIWTENADSCHFTYKQVTGDCAIIAKVESLQTTGSNARVGIMLRSDLTPTAANRAWLGVKPDHKLEFYQHGWTNVWSGSYRAKGVREFPESESYWLKIERLGNVISLELSVDGASWFGVTAGEYKLPDTTYIGLMVCSNGDGTPCTARFSHVRVTGGNGAPVLSAPEAPRNIMASPGAKQVQLRWTSSHDATSYHVKRALTQGGPYTPIATVTGNSYTDTDVTNDTTYYYVVSAMNSIGESPNSPEDAATPRALMWNVTFGGTATATVSQDSADKVFDSNTATRWFAGASPTGAVQYDFGAGRAPVIERYTVTSANDVPERDPKDWLFQCSNDGTNWTTVDTQKGQTFPARFYEMEYAVAKPAAYRYYRLNVTANSGAPALQIADIKMLSTKPIPNAPVSALIHWRANDSADREQATKAIEARK